MRRLFGMLLLITCLSMPTFAGHNQTGGGACTCGSPGCLEDYPGECSGDVRTTATQSTQSTDEGSDLTSELGIALVAILVWMRMRA